MAQVSRKNHGEYTRAYVQHEKLCRWTGLVYGGQDLLKVSDRGYRATSLPAALYSFQVHAS